jgi:hypothetical protein
MLKYGMHVSSAKDLENMLFSLAAVEGTFVIGVPTRYLSERGQNIPMAIVADIQEYGLPKRKIPARPVLIPLMDSKGPSWQRSAMSRALTATRMRNKAPRDLFRRLGAKIVRDIELAYLVNRTEDNKKSTQDRKGRNDPLLDSKQLSQIWRMRWVSANKKPPAGLVSLVRGFSKLNFTR